MFLQDTDTTKQHTTYWYIRCIQIHKVRRVQSGEISQIASETGLANLIQKTHTLVCTWSVNQIFELVQWSLMIDQMCLLAQVTWTYIWCPNIWERTTVWNCRAHFVGLSQSCVGVCAQIMPRLHVCAHCSAKWTGNLGT